MEEVLEEAQVPSWPKNWPADGWSKRDGHHWGGRVLVFVNSAKSRISAHIDELSPEVASRIIMSNLRAGRSDSTNIRAGGDLALRPRMVTQIVITANTFVLTQNLSDREVLPNSRRFLEKVFGSMASAAQTESSHLNKSC
jgi:hypothetical protein